MIKKLLLNNSKFFSIILMLLAFCGNVKSQTYTITGNRDAGTLSCGIFVGKNIISIGDGTETPSNLIMNDDLNLTLLGCSTNPLQIIVNNGTIDFSTANKRLYLPEGSSISLLNGGTLNPSGGNGGGCAGNDRIYIGGIILATCQGGAGIVSFEDIIAFEGSGSTISNSPVCVGNSINLSAIPPPKGSPYTYTWYEPSVSPNTSIGTGQNISIASATSGSHIYQVKMYSASLNKTMIANATVVVNSVTGPSAPAVTLTQPTCAVATGTITITTPVTGIQYSINGLTYTTTTTFSSLVSGVYSVTAKNSSGCISSATSTTINAQPTSPAGLSYTVASPSYCVGSLITTNSATLITAGSPAATYAVSPTLPAGLSLNITTGQITGTPTTAVASAGYTVTASNTSGCGTATSVVTITVNALPTAGLTSNDADNTFCAGTSVTFTATGGTSYNFRVGGTTVQNGATTTYTTSTLTNGQVVDVIVTNASNCVATSSGITNTVNPLPTPGLTSNDADNTFCAGTSVTFTATGGTSYNFRVGGTTVQNGSTTTYTTSTLTNGQVVDVIVTNASNCVATSSGITNTVNPLPNNVTDGFSATIICAGGSPQLTYDAIDATFTTPYSITYKNNASPTLYTVSVTSKDNFVFTPDDNPTSNSGYTLVSISNATCTNSSDFSFGKSGANLIVRLIPTVVISGTTSVCVGSTSPNVTFTNPQSVDITVTYTINGVSQTINVGNNSSSSVAASTTVSGSFVYDLVSVAYQSTPNCSNTLSGSATVTINPLPSTPTITTTQPNCSLQSGTITITAVAGETYSFDGGIYSATLVYSGLAQGSTHSISAKNSASGCISVASSNVTISPLVEKTWNGTSWSPNGEPTSDNLVVINGDYTTTSINPVLYACSLVINADSTLKVQAGTSVIIQNDLTVNLNGTLDLLDKGSLVMVNDLGKVTNTGKTYVRRSTTPFKKFDYVYWSTPVTTSSIVNTFQSIGWNTNRAYEYIPGNDWSFASTMSPGKGYIIMVPTPTSDPGTDTSNVVFSGEVNNGDKIKITGVIPNSSYLLGNPYPSAINADKFLDANAGVLDGTLYFWTHNTAIQLASNIDPGKAGSGALAFTSNDYATYNRTGGVATAAAISPGLNASIPTGEIASGQGFFGSSKVTLGSVKEIVYNNSMRLAGTISGGIGINEQFFKTSNTKSKTASVLEKHRIWLELKNSQGAFKQILVGYITGATNDYDSRFDGESFDGNDFVDFYSIYQNKNLTIQGRALPFDENDTVILGFKSTIDGSFTINIGQVDGLLINQAIYLEDKLTNTIFDLKTGNYTFTTAKGTFNNRFVLRYTNDKTLGIGDMDKDDGILVFYSNNYKTLIIKNNSDAIINSVALFNMAGQNSTNWNSIDGEQTNIHIPIKNASSGAYIVKITTTKGEISKKIIIK